MMIQSQPLTAGIAIARELRMTVSKDGDLKRRSKDLGSKSHHHKAWRRVVRVGNEKPMKHAIGKGGKSGGGLDVRSLGRLSIPQCDDRERSTVSMCLM